MWLPVIASLLRAGQQPPAADIFRRLLAGCLPDGHQPGPLLAEAEKQWNWPLARTDALTRPRLINICGLPGSGKTYELNRLRARCPGYAHLAFDQIMEGLGGYQRDYQESRAWAFQRWERPARILGYYGLTKAVEKGRSILFEHGNTVVHHLSLYKIMKEVYGYYLEIRWLNSPPELVRPRLSGRERHFPEQKLKSRWLRFQQLMPAYKALAHEFIELEGWRE